MPEGFQAVNDYGTLQIDSDFTNLSVLRRGQLTTANYSNGSVTNTRPTRANLAINDNELVAFACTSPTAIVAKDGNEVVFSTDSPAGAVISYWVFGLAGPVSNTGLQVFKADGSIAFDAGWQLLKFLGQTAGNGGYGYPGTTIAVIPQVMYLLTEYASVVQGVAPAVFILDSRNSRMSAASISGSSLNISTAIVDSWGMTRSYPNEIGPNGQSDNGVVPSYLVVDVTGY